MGAHVAGKVAGSLLGDENSAPAENLPEERQRRFWGAVAHAAGQFAKGFMGHETDVATASENLHNTYAQLSVERQRRFWGAVAHAAGQFAKGFLGDAEPTAE